MFFLYIALTLSLSLPLYTPKVFLSQSWPQISKINELGYYSRRLDGQQQLCWKTVCFGTYPFHQKLMDF